MVETKEDGGEMLANEMETMSVKEANKPEAILSPQEVILAALTPQQCKTVSQLRLLQSEYKTLHEEFVAEHALLRAKYQLKYKPVYEKRREALCEAGEEAAVEGDFPKATPRLPQFWLKCFQNSSALADMIEDHDTPIFEYLEDVTVEWLSEDKRNRGFKLMFTFLPNPYFHEPLVLQKQYNLSVPEGDSQPVLNSTMSTMINWKEGKNVTRHTVERQQKNKKTKQTRVITEEVDCASFFHFFCSHQLPTDEELQNMEDRQVSTLELVIEADYETGVLIRDKIIPQAIEWYLGEASDEEEDFDDDSGESSGGGMSSSES